MARYATRDMIGHFVSPASAAGKMCPHACCRNRRVHPENYPVILPSKLLRRASDADLAKHYDSTDNEAARAQVLYEMERRDQAEASRRARREAYAQRLFNQRVEREEAVEWSYTRAEDATNGYMLNRAGNAAGVSPRSLFTGSETRARRYASEELLNHWQENPRPTAAMHRGQDTRIGAQYTASRRKQYGVTTRSARIPTGRGRRRQAVDVVIRE